MRYVAGVCARARAPRTRPTSQAPAAPPSPCPWGAPPCVCGVDPAAQAQPPACRRSAAAAPAPALLSVEAVAGRPAGPGSGDARSQPPAAEGDCVSGGGHLAFASSSARSVAAELAFRHRPSAETRAVRGRVLGAQRGRRVLALVGAVRHGGRARPASPARARAACARTVFTLHLAALRSPPTAAPRARGTSTCRARRGVLKDGQWGGRGTTVAATHIKLYEDRVYFSVWALYTTGECSRCVIAAGCCWPGEAKVWRERWREAMQVWGGYGEAAARGEVAARPARSCSKVR